MNSYAKALEVIPRTIADNSGLDSVEILNKLRQKHATDPEGFECNLFNFYRGTKHWSWH